MAAWTVPKRSARVEIAKMITTTEQLQQIYHVGVNSNLIQLPSDRSAWFFGWVIGHRNPEISGYCGVPLLFFRGGHLTMVQQSAIEQLTSKVMPGRDTAPGFFRVGARSREQRRD